ncbi:3-oxoadipate CoA-transferase subunit A [Primorskyibacter flagellatus]|uniref:3-oxoadipate CoA-transferase subunit A n=1 Tax=Primorskyibacter flagellatus TaxID=1387277 RepID=A0A916ZZX3_9RHOB|nr:3-oxoacid CoA-transferase subunit A [Primorskyibacter flagellatus]GGE20717.1 3-oxoadipate CoA-transferase subunit A [Primorskyibacter flagellatus]
MLDRRCNDLAEAFAGIGDGARVMVAGFGEAGRPNMLIKALLDSGIKDLDLISNNAGDGETGLAALFRAGRVRKLTCSFPRGAMQDVMLDLVTRGEMELEVMPQGTLAERIRAGGCGIPAFYTPTSFGTLVAEGKETREFDGRGHVLETALKAEIGLVKAHKADRFGNLTFENLARNFNPLIAAAATRTIVEADEIVELGDIDPHNVHSPGVFTNYVFTTQPVSEESWQDWRKSA